MNSNNEKFDVLNLESVVFTNDYIKDVKNILQKAKSYSYKAVNSIMVETNWLIGYRIVEEEQKGNEKAKYGEKLIENLSKELSKELSKGMSVAQLWNCRQFYQVFQDKKILYTLCRELSWSHIRLIMRLDTEDERNYYREPLISSKLSTLSIKKTEKMV